MKWSTVGEEGLCFARPGEYLLVRGHSHFRLLRVQWQLAAKYCRHLGYLWDEEGELLTEAAAGKFRKEGRACRE